MANYKLGPVIGKIGGADVQKIPVNIVADGGSGSIEVGHTVEVPGGEAWLVGIFGQADPANTLSGNTPRIIIGDLFESENLSGRPYPVNFFWVISGPATVDLGILRRYSGGQDVVTGNVYTVPLPQ